MKVPVYTQLIEEHKADVGVKNEIYLDHLG